MEESWCLPFPKIRYLDLYDVIGDNDYEWWGIDEGTVAEEMEWEGKSHSEGEGMEKGNARGEVIGDEESDGKGKKKGRKIKQQRNHIEKHIIANCNIPRIVCFIRHIVNQSRKLPSCNQLALTLSLVSKEAILFEGEEI